MAGLVGGVAAAPDVQVRVAEAEGDAKRCNMIVHGCERKLHHAAELAEGLFGCHLARPERGSKGLCVEVQWQGPRQATTQHGTRQQAWRLAAGWTGAVPCVYVVWLTHACACRVLSNPQTMMNCLIGASKGLLHMRFQLQVTAQLYCAFMKRLRAYT